MLHFLLNSENSTNTLFRKPRADYNQHFLALRHCPECHLVPRRIDFAPHNFARLYNSLDPEYIAA